MIDDVPEPECMYFDTLSVLEMEEDEAGNQSVLSSQFEFSSQLDHSARTPKLSIATNTTKTGGAKTKVTYSSKHDEFDYNSYIREELEKLKAEELDPQTRKRLIQKIRNRMSAQRSRNRNKMVMGQLQDENQYLRLHNNELIQKLQLLKEENSFLRDQMNENKPSKRSISTDALDGSREEDDPVPYRKSSPQAVTLYKNVLVISAIVLAITMAPNQTPESVKLGGVVPLLTTDLAKSVKQLQSMESICKGYCLRHHRCDDEPLDSVTKELRLLAEITKEVQLYTGSGSKDKLVPLMCFEEKNEKVKHVFLFKESSLQVVKKDKEMLYAPELVIVKPDIGFIDN